jgi:hypothetical protein
LKNSQKLNSSVKSRTWESRKKKSF